MVKVLWCEEVSAANGYPVDPHCGRTHQKHPSEGSAVLSSPRLEVAD